MKRILSTVFASVLLAGCGLNQPGNANTTTGSAAVYISADVNITETVTGADTPTDEANDNVSKIDKVKVTVTDSSSKELASFLLNKTEGKIKGQIFKFDSQYKAVPSSGHAKFKFTFNDKNNNKLFETEGAGEIKSKGIYDVKGQLDQVSIKRDPKAPETLKVSIDEKKETSYVAGEFLIGCKTEITEDEMKTLLEKEGIKVSSVKKGVLSIYNVKFSSPSMAEALIITSKIDKFEYVELNGIVSLN